MIALFPAASSATGNPLDAQDDIAGRIGADDVAVRFQPVTIHHWALLGRQQRKGGLKGIETEMTMCGDVQPPVAQDEAITRLHSGSAFAPDLLHDHT